jgi:hypothetical protein
MVAQVTIENVTGSHNPVRVKVAENEHDVAPGSKINVSVEGEEVISFSELLPKKEGEEEQAQSQDSTLSP